MDENEFKKMIKTLLAEHEAGLKDNETLITELSAKVKELLTDELSDIETIKSNIETLTEELGGFSMLKAESITIPDKLYKGVWGSAEVARDFGLYVLSSVAGSQKATEMLKEKGYVLERDFNEQDNTEGALLAPTHLIDTLIMLIESHGKFRPNVNTYPMGSDSSAAPMLVNLLEVFCPAAGVTATKSDASFKPVGLNAKEWVTYCAIDRNLDEDAAIAIGNLVGLLIAMAFALKEDEIGFLGDGTEQYFGMLGIIGALVKTAGLAGVLDGSGTAWTNLTLADFTKLIGIVPDYADDGMNLKWYCSRTFYYHVMLPLALASGGATATEVLSTGSSRQKTFLGYPVEFVHVMPKVTAVGKICCIFGNLRLGAWLGDRRKMTVEQSTEALFTQRQIAIMGTERVAITVFGIGDTEDAGPICALKTADA